MERVEDIAQSIKEHRILEDNNYIPNKAFARSLTFFNGDFKTFWLVNYENINGYDRRELDGSVTRVNTGQSTLTSHGQPIYKNRPLAGVMISNHEGIHLIPNLKDGQTFEIFSRASFNPYKRTNELATDLQIRIAGDPTLYSFTTISSILDDLEKIQSARLALEKAETEEAKQQAEELQKREFDYKVKLTQAQNFVRDAAQLRYQPILDPIQEYIKRSKIFEGTLIINGGPGTGKTTSLIQRIRFLISYTITEEYLPHLPEKQKAAISQKDKIWIFYSPSELLALFLRDSMSKEGLSASTDTVKVWNEHLIDIIKAYKLVDVTKQRPFLFYGKSNTQSLIQNSSESVQKILKDLIQAFISHYLTKFQKIIDLDISKFSWERTGKSIQNYLNGKKNFISPEDVIRLFNNLRENYLAENQEIVRDYTRLINETTSHILLVIKRDPSRVTALSNFLQSLEQNNANESEEEDQDLTENELEDFEENLEIEIPDFEINLSYKLKTLSRKMAQRKYDANVKLTPTDKELLKLIPEAEDQPEYQTIGQIAFFKKYFESILRGVIPNVLRELPVIYKEFRKKQFASENNTWNLKLLGELIKTSQNKRLHPDEQALLLYFVNSINQVLALKFPAIYTESTHPYLEGYKNFMKPVIGIDEATDFSILDILAMNSLRHPEISSVTLSGDIMQRMTQRGITSWEQVTSLLPDAEVSSLEVSYRQSPTLLSLANSIYHRMTGISPNYQSYLQKSPDEPKPMLLVSEDPDEKLDWITHKILRIYKDYGSSIPSIAIFLPNEDVLDRFARNLGEKEELADVGIWVKACRDGQVLGDKSTVRVFSIDKIKGLEFEAVFFYDLDDLLHENLGQDLLLKYLYVGLSRATFHLGITLKRELPEGFAFLDEYFRLES